MKNQKKYSRELTVQKIATDAPSTKTMSTIWVIILFYPKFGAKVISKTALFLTGWGPAVPVRSCHTCDSLKETSAQTRLTPADPVVKGQRAGLHWQMYFFIFTKSLYEVACDSSLGHAHKIQRLFSGSSCKLETGHIFWEKVLNNPMKLYLIKT